MALAGQSFLSALIVIFLGFWPLIGMAADPEVLRLRVPSDQFVAVRALENPYPSTPELIEKGKALFHGKGFCVSCHGKEGKVSERSLALEACFHGISRIQPGKLPGRMVSCIGFFKMEVPGPTWRHSFS